MSNSNPSSYSYSIPDGVRVYAIGDVHGHLEALQAMHLKIDTHMYENPVEKPIIVYLGDYVDRGPQSKQVIERLFLLQQEDSGVERYFIKGNHELGMCLFVNTPLQLGVPYLKWGGLETLESYGVDIPNHITQDSITEGLVLPAEYERLSDEFRTKIPSHHLEFLESLPLYVQIGDYLFVHAGIKPDVALKDQEPQDLMRIRNVFLDHPHDHGYRVVHGHTIEPEVNVKSNRIGVETGVFETGILSCVALEKDQVDILQIKHDIGTPWKRPTPAPT